MDSSQSIGIIDIESQMMEVQVNNGLRWSQRHKLPVTAILMEPIKPLDVRTLANTREDLEYMLRTTITKRYPKDTILHDERKTLVILKCDLAQACDILKGYQDELKQEGIIMAGYPQMHEPYIPPAKPKPAGLWGRIKAYVNELKIQRPMDPRPQLEQSPVQNIFYSSLVEGFERSKAVLKEEYCKPVSTKKGYSQPASQPVLSLAG
jgi:hypothetical protein